MSAVVRFTSSDAFIEADECAGVCSVVSIADYLEGTYGMLRTGPDGREIAELVDGAWELPDGRRFSDWAVELEVAS